MEQAMINGKRPMQMQVLFSYGFRPFFLFGALWVALAMVVWVMALTGVIDIPSRFDPVSWHAHALLFGYLGAVIAGFLMTAVPNWTGRAPIRGWPLAMLFAVWLAGRVAVLVSLGLPSAVVVVIDLAFPVVLGLAILREIVAGKNWRNLIVLVMLTVFTLANLVFHIEAAEGRIAAGGYGMRLGVASVLMMVCVIGGRIVPSFTSSWLRRRGSTTFPAPPMQRFDKLALLAMLSALILWVVWPHDPVTAAALVVAGVLHLIRLARWVPWLTFADPLVWVLHLAYSFVPLGAFLIALSTVAPEMISRSAAPHLWMGGAFGLMTLAVMTRASLAHTAQALRAGRGTTGIYLALVAAVLLRLAGGYWPDTMIYQLSALCWIVAFGGFALLYGPALCAPRKDKA